MATKVGEFFINLAVDTASGNLSVNELIASLGELSVSSVAGAAGVTKITQALLGMANAATNTAVEMSVLKDVAGSDPKMVQQWEKAAQRMHIHAGSIVQAVKGVNDMMGGIQSMKSSPPGELTGWLGVTPQKGKDAQGRPVMKSFFDLMGEIAKPGSKYWGFQPAVQQQLLGGAFPGADSKDLFRILNEMRAGKFRPQDISVLEDKQVTELTAVKRKETEIGQQIVGIFDKLILGGEGLARILGSVSEKLEVIDKWLASKQGNAVLGGIGEGTARIVRNVSLNPLTGFGIGNMGVETGQDIARFFGINPPKGSPAGPLRIDDLSGKLDINIMGLGAGAPVRKQAFIGRKVTNADVEQVTINAGNGGLGQ